MTANFAQIFCLGKFAHFDSVFGEAGISSSRWLLLDTPYRRARCLIASNVRHGNEEAQRVTHLAGRHAAGPPRSGKPGEDPS
jgi:hypothetical protein